MNLKNRIRMGIRAAYAEDVSSNHDGLGQEEQADAIAELLVGESSSSNEETAEEPKKVANQEEELEGDSDDEETLSEESEPEEESEEEANDEDDDEGTWESVLGLDESLLDIDDKGVVKGVKVKVNGESEVVGMKDLVAGYQTNKAVTLRSQELAETRKVFAEQVQKVSEEYKSKLNAVGGMASYLESELLGEYNSIDWEQLRVTNPAEYAAARQDYSARAQSIQEAKQAIGSEMQELSQEQINQQKQQFGTYLQSQYNTLIERNPGWSKPEVYKQEMAKMSSFLTEHYGYDEREFAEVTDARIISLVQDAMKFRAGVKSVQTKLKKPVPKFQKSTGGAKKKGTSKLEKLTKMAKEAKGANKRELQSDAIANLLMGE